MAGTIVVGVDGSSASNAALRWAAEEAALRGARLVALHAWAFVPAASIGDPGLLAVPVGDLPGQLDAEQAVAEAELEGAMSSVDLSDLAVEVEKRLFEGDAGEAIVAESAEADLVVVGSQGKSGLRAALLGSVSRHVTSHASCPVVVVKAHA
jgi:nucleotide-binding universal stress UspA family protein